MTVKSHYQPVEVEYNIRDLQTKKQLLFLHSSHKKNMNSRRILSIFEQNEKNLNLIFFFIISNRTERVQKPSEATVSLKYL
jgi:hypothetical protein